MQPGSPGPGQDPYQPDPHQPSPFQPSPFQPDPYQQYPTGYGQVPQYPDPFGSPVQPTEYTIDPQVSPPPPPPPPYPPAGYGVPPMMPMQLATRGQNNTLGLLAMIFGILSIPLLACCYLGVPFGVAAIVLGILGAGKANRGEADNKGMAIAGVVTGSIAMGLVVVGIILYAVGSSALIPHTV
jgi:Domain of unknown function (DUF4190)